MRKSCFIQSRECQHINTAPHYMGKQWDQLIYIHSSLIEHNYEATRFTHPLRKPRPYMPEIR